MGLPTHTCPTQSVVRFTAPASKRKETLTRATSAARGMEGVTDRRTTGGTGSAEGFAKP